MPAVSAALLIHVPPLQWGTGSYGQSAVRFVTLVIMPGYSAVDISHTLPGSGTSLRVDLDPFVVNIPSAAAVAPLILVPVVVGYPVPQPSREH